MQSDSCANDGCKRSVRFRSRYSSAGSEAARVVTFWVGCNVVLSLFLARDTVVVRSIEEKLRSHVHGSKRRSVLAARRGVVRCERAALKYVSVCVKLPVKERWTAVDLA